MQKAVANKKNIEYLKSINDNSMIFLLAYLYVHHLIFSHMVCICIQLWIHLEIG